jgi:cytochrome P450
MSNKFGHFEKLKFPALSKLLGDGVASHEGEKWVKHRRILNPAFHLEKLKVRTFSDRLISSVVDFVTHGFLLSTADAPSVFRML